MNGEVTNTPSVKQNKAIIILLSILIILVILVGLWMFFNKGDDNPSQDNTVNTNTNTNSNNSNTSTTAKKISFKSLDATDNSLNEDQKELAKFFDEDYFFIQSYQEMLRYSDTLKGIRVALYCQVKNFISTTNNEYEVVCNWGNSDDYFWGIDDTKLRDSVIIRGKKPDSMFLVNDTLTIKGTLAAAETISVNGKNYYLPVINVVDVGVNANWFSESSLRKVSKLVFGNDIKVRRPTDEENSKMVDYDIYSYHDSLWLIEFENQSNLNFKVFDIWASNPYGIITYNAIHNQGVDGNNLNKYLYITPDLQKYIVFDMSWNDKYIYISVYDRKLNKIWSREISNVSRIVWDATDTQLVFVSDNDMYNINLETGENIREPLFVGKKTNIRIVENGIILLNESTDDAVMFVDNDGKITNKFDINMKISNKGLLDTTIQKIDNNYVILYCYVEVKETINVTSKYIIIDQNGKLIKETK